VKRIFAFFLFIMWTLFVAKGYWQHHPEYVSVFGHVLEALPYIGLLLFFLLICLLFGSKVLSSLKLSPNFSERLIFSVGIGMVLFVYIGFLMGALRLLYKHILLSISLLIMIFCIREAKCLIWQKAKKKREADGMLWPFVVVILLISLLSVFTPRISWDGATYHLYAPRVYIENRGFCLISRNICSNMPFNIEMLYMLALLAKDYILAKLIHFAFSVLLIFAISSFCSRFLSARCASLSCLVFVTNPVVTFEMSICYIDIALAFYSFCALYSFILWTELKEKRWLWVSAIFCGTALGVKYTAFFFLLVLAIGIGVELVFVQRERMVRMVKDVAIFSAISLTLLSPWLIKNIILVKNPVYPLLYNIFGGVEWCREFSVGWKNFFYSIGMGRELLDYLLLPFRMVVMGNMGHSRFDGTVNPLYLIFVPLLPFCKLNKVILYLLGYSLLFLCFWALTTQQMRFFIPALPALSMMTAHSIDGLSKVAKKDWAWYVLLVFVIAVSAFCELPHAKKVLKDDLSVLLGTESKDAYLTRTHQPYAMFCYINRELPEDSKLLFIWENRGFFCKRDYISDTLFEVSWIMKAAREGGVDGFKNLLTEMGITHILVNCGLQSLFCRERGMEVVEQFLAKYCRKLYSKHYLELYEIR
jgi:hypothetical protein